MTRELRLQWLVTGSLHPPLLYFQVSKGNVRLKTTLFGEKVIKNNPRASEINSNTHTSTLMGAPQIVLTSNAFLGERAWCTSLCKSLLVTSHLPCLSIPIQTSKINQHKQVTQCCAISPGKSLTRGHCTGHTPPVLRSPRPGLRRSTDIRAGTRRTGRTQRRSSAGQVTWGPSRITHHR